ncbi:hypothetical protein OUZ56_010318 [Daphnia magna]|uniref:Uncharacterized protein n=1 Tax=Daphnia magna TaxID=35525 RepID=A0ABR0AIA7_9CRUS|nr:hypothetical protein OUZ56_010318 [Daphnia magna]
MSFSFLQDHQGNIAANIVASNHAGQPHFTNQSLFSLTVFAVFFHLGFGQLVYQMDIRVRLGEIFHRLIVET